ncbi:MAG: response regulator transcription factor [Phycisphaerales bacterium]
MRVLIVEDSAVLRDSLAQGLREAGFAVDAVADGKRGLIHAQTTDYDVVVLDWMLPVMDGLTVLSRLRAKRVDAAVLMLTARDALDDRVLGLTTGADDYLVKPFAFKELLARVTALGRRRHGERSPIIRIGPLTIDSSAKTARVGERKLSLAPREYSLLEYLALRQGKPVPRAELEEHLYDDRSQVLSNAIDAAVYSLRSTLEAAGCPALIHTRRKVGYVLSVPEPGTPESERD